MLESLDNPIWFALTTEHRSLALLARFCATISAGCFTAGSFASSHERRIRRFTTADQSRRTRRALYRKSPRCARWMARRPFSLDRSDDLRGFAGASTFVTGCTRHNRCSRNACARRCHRARPVLAPNDPDGKVFRDARERWAVGRDGRGAITIPCIFGNQRGVHSSRISRPWICAGPRGVPYSPDSGSGKDSFSSRQV